MKANEFVKKFGWDAVKHKADELKIIESMGDKLSIEDNNLIHLIESYELVESYGGLFEAKIYADSEYRSLSVPQITRRLKQAILDVESCNENTN